MADPADLDFPSYSEAITEARRRYENEEARRDGIENKISILVTIDVLVITLSGAVNENTPPEWPAVLPALLSTIFGLLIIAPKWYANPTSDRYYSYAREDETELQDILLASYSHAIELNEKINNLKISIFKFCIILTLSSVFLIFATPTPSPKPIVLYLLVVLPYFSSLLLVSGYFTRLFLWSFFEL